MNKYKKKEEFSEILKKIIYICIQLLRNTSNKNIGLFKKDCIKDLTPK